VANIIENSGVRRKDETRLVIFGGIESQPQQQQASSVEEACRK